jgi:two-component system sensor histidine kinase YesM
MRNLYRSLKTWFINVSMAGKLTLLLVVAGVIPILLIATYSYNQTYNALLDKTRESMAHTSRQINSQIDGQLSSYQQISSMLYTDNNLKSYLTKNYVKDYDFVLAYDYINSLMYGLMASNNGLSGITIYTDNPTLPSDGMFVLPRKNANEGVDWLLQDKSSYGNVIFSGPRYNKNGERIWSMGRKMNFNNHSYAYAYLVVDVLESALYEQIRYENSDSRMYVISEGGIILSASDKNLIGENISSVLGKTETDSKGGSQTIMKLGGKNHMVVTSPLQNGWHTVMVIPLSGITGEVAAASAKIAGIAAVCLLLSLALVYAISGYFSSRLKVLNRQVARIESNDLSCHITVAGNDELARLSHAMNTMALKLDEAIHIALKEEIDRKYAHLSLLQSQINPHFLYNTLSGISALALRGGDEQVSRFLNHLSQFYKTSLNQGREMITIEEEISITRHYIALQNMRFRDRLVIHWDFDESLGSHIVPKLILQPFIENIVDHALRPGKEPLLVSIRIIRDTGKIIFEITDNGVGIPPEMLETLLDKGRTAGYGIVNVYDRLRLLYGESCSMTISSDVGKGTKVFIRVPDEQVDSEKAGFVS